MTRTYSEEEKQAAVKVFQEHGAAAAAKQTGINDRNIRRWAAAAGITSGAVDTMAAAHEARRVSLAARRSEEAMASMDLAKQLRERLFLAREVTTVTKDGEIVTYDEATTARDWRDTLTAYGIALDKSMALEKFNGDGSAERAKSMLDRIADQIGVPDE